MRVLVQWHCLGMEKMFNLPSLDETRPTTLPPIMPPMQKMATTKDQMKVTEVSHALFRESHSSRLPLVSWVQREGVVKKELLEGGRGWVTHGSQLERKQAGTLQQFQPLQEDALKAHLIFLDSIYSDFISDMGSFEG